MMSGSCCTGTAFAVPGLNQEQNCQFQMPLHYPKYKKSDYQIMPEWKVDFLLNQYGLPVIGDVAQKRKFAIGAFLWPSQK